MAEFAVFAESMQEPSRAILQIDKDITRSCSGEQKRLLRCKAVVYSASRHAVKELGLSSESRADFASMANRCHL
jgi:hypothetical protein